MQEHNRPPSWIMFTNRTLILKILFAYFDLTFIFESEYSVWLFLVQAVRHSYFFDVWHFMQSTSESCLPSWRIGRLAWTIFARVFSPLLKQHCVFLDNKIGFAGVLPRNPEFFQFFVAPAQSRHFAAVYLVFQPWSEPLSFCRHLARCVGRKAWPVFLWIYFRRKFKLYLICCRWKIYENAFFVD